MRHPKGSRNSRAQVWEIALEELGLAGRGFERPCEEWEAYRREAKLKAWTARGWRAKLQSLADPERLGAAVAHSIGNGYQGLFEPHSTTGTAQSRDERNAAVIKKILGGASGQP